MRKRTPLTIGHALVTSGALAAALAGLALMAGPAAAQPVTPESLTTWQKVAERQDLIGDGRHVAVVTLRNRIASIADGKVVVEAEQVMEVPPQDPVPERPAGITRTGALRLTATAKVADLDLRHVDVVRNAELPVEDRIRGANRGRYLTLPCSNNAKCWQLTGVQTSDTAPGEAHNQHQEKPFADLQRDTLPTYWADAKSAEQAKDLLVASLQKALPAAQ